MSLFTASTWLNLVRLATLLLSIGLAWVTYRSHLFLKEYKPDFNVLLSLPDLIVRVGLVGLCLGLAWLSGLPATELGLIINQPSQTIGLGVGIGLATVIIINLLTTWSINQFGPHIYSPLVIYNVLPRRSIEWGLVALAFLPAVAMEELLFRTLWLGGFKGVVPMGLLIIGTSILFGFMHRPQGQLGMVLAGGINILFSTLFVWSGQILLPLSAHYTVNLLQLVVAYRQKDWLKEYWPEK